MNGNAHALPPTDPNSSELLKALKWRRTSREYSAKPLGNHLLANLLWAANGVNRASGARTAPAGHNVQTVDLYVSDANGLYRYEPPQHALTLIKTGDIRALTGLQDYPATAPVNLIFVHDERKFGTRFTPEERALFPAVGAGAIMQNVYLYCAANHLNTGVRSDIDRAALAKAMGLAPEQRILIAQSVGFPPTMQAIKDTVKSLIGRD